MSQRLSTVSLSKVVWLVFLPTGWPTGLPPSHTKDAALGAALGFLLKGTIMSSCIRPWASHLCRRTVYLHHVCLKVEKMNYLFGFWKKKKPQWLTSTVRGTGRGCKQHHKMTSQCVAAVSIFMGPILQSADSAAWRRAGVLINARKWRGGRSHFIGLALSVEPSATYVNMRLFSSALKGSRWT